MPKIQTPHQPLFDWAASTNHMTDSCGCKSIIKFHQIATQLHIPILALTLLELARAQLPLHPSSGLVAVLVFVSLFILGSEMKRNHFGLHVLGYIDIDDLE